MTKYPVSPEHAAKLRNWLETRGGVAYWTSLDLSDPGWTSYSPASQKDGRPYAKPHWKANDTPVIITDIDAFEVDVPKEVARFHIAIRRGGFSYKLTDASTKKVRAAVDRWSERNGKAWYEFDYGSQEAVILVADRVVPLAEFALTPEAL